ncbi:MAG: hypothetical protein ACP5N0_08730 [Methanosarcina sp.]|uniref:hypothetical protein n=1 Tax=Methanosarcina sp. TaxID=2213 RepID=UPI003BB7FDD6
MFKQRGRGNLVAGMTTYELRAISFGLQIVALLIFVLSLIVLKATKSKREGVIKHGKIVTGGYALAVLSVFYMLYSAYNLIITGNAPSVIYIHGLFGAITLALGFIFVINRWNWKTRENMRIQLALWTLTFSGGMLLYLIFIGKFT